MKTTKKTNKNKVPEFVFIQGQLINTNTPHTIKISGSSTTIKAGKNSYFFPNDGEFVDSKYLKFISDTKQEVCDNSERLKLPFQSPSFYTFSLGKKNKIRNCIEIDINGAYWQTAFMCGLITETTYNAGLLVPKEVRLMAFGAAATMKDVYIFNGENYNETYPEFNEYGRRAFFYVAKKVSDLMGEIVEGALGSFCLFWVDAVFVHCSYAPYIQKRLLSAGYQCKTREVPHILIRPADAPGRPDIVIVTEIEERQENFTKIKIKKFKNFKKNQNKNRKKIIKNPLFAVE